MVSTCWGVKRGHVSLLLWVLKFFKTGLAWLEQEYHRCDDGVNDGNFSFFYILLNFKNDLARKLFLKSLPPIWIFVAKYLRRLVSFKPLNELVKWRDQGDGASRKEVTRLKDTPQYVHWPAAPEWLRWRWKQSGSHAARRKQGWKIPQHRVWERSVLRKLSAAPLKQPTPLMIIATEIVTISNQRNESI